MAKEQNGKLSELLQNLKTSLDSASEVTPDTLLVPADGVSILNLKNELFLSYLQSLSFLIIVKLRHASFLNDSSEEAGSLAKIHPAVIEKLVHVRLYLDKGVRPLESRLKYQMDRVIKVAEDASTPVHIGMERNLKNPKVPGPPKFSPPANDASDDSASEAESESASDQDPEAFAYRANPFSFGLRSIGEAKNTSNPMSEAIPSNNSTGVYKPPRMNPTVLPTTDLEVKAPRTKLMGRSATLDEYVATELSSAPLVLPSIGRTIRSGGRATLTDRERHDIDDRTRYEEDNLTRLPLAGKRGKNEKNKNDRQEFGGEEWRGLGESADRIGKLLSKKAGRGGMSMLDRSRKRSDDFDAAEVGKKRKF